MTAGLPYRSGHRIRLAVTHRTSALVLLGAILFVANGGLFRMGEVNGVVWLLLTTAVGGLALRDVRAAVAACRAGWVAFLLPVLLLVTTVWSVTPAATLSEAAKMLVTVAICCVLWSRLGARMVMVALFWSMSVAVGLSLLNLLVVFFPPVFEVNGAFLGIFAQKTQVARAAVWLAFSAVALSGSRAGPLLIAIVVGVALFPVAIMAKSATGTVGFGFAAVLAGALVLLRLPDSLRLALPVLAVLGVTTIGAIYVATGAAPLAGLLSLAGKSQTLTGRTDLWDIGLAVWRDSPLVGLGYGGFWNGVTFAAERAVIEAQVDDGLNGFHNGIVELLVGSGVVGTAVWAVVVVWAAARLLPEALVRRSIDATVWLVVLLALVVMALFETSLFAPRSLNLMLMTFALLEASAVRQRGVRGAGRGVRSASGTVARGRRSIR